MNCHVKALHIDLAINLGLIITELVTNAHKHAFKTKRNQDQITVNIKQKTDNRLELVVQDNGVGYIPNSEKTKSLGLEIVEALTEQIDGELVTSSGNGVTHAITFGI